MGWGEGSTSNVQAPEPRNAAWERRHLCGAILFPTMRTERCCCTYTSRLNHRHKLSGHVFRRGVYRGHIFEINKWEPFKFCCGSVSGFSVTGLVSRSEALTVAVGFSPRIGLVKWIRRGATIENRVGSFGLSSDATQ